MEPRNEDEIQPVREDIMEQEEEIIGTFLSMLNEEEESEEQQEEQQAASSMQTAPPSADDDIIIHPLGVYNVDPPAPTSWIISPLHPRYRFWHGVMLVLITYSAWAYPFEIAFLKTSSRYSLTKLYIFDFLVDIFFFVDLILTFFVGFFDPTTHLLILKPSSIAERYLSTWFIIDFASMLPVEVVVYIFVTRKHTGLVISILSLLRLFRLRHVEQFFTRLEKDIRFSYNRVRFVKLLCLALYFVHCVGCTYYYLAAVNPYQERSWRRSINQIEGEKGLFAWFVSATYWSMTTFTTVGYGDIHPENVTEDVFSSIVQICYTIALIYFSGNVTELIIETKRAIKEFRNNLENLARLANRNQLPLRLRQQISAYMCLSFEARSLNEKQAIEQLPMTLQNKIRWSLYLPTLERVYLFSGLDRETSSLLVARMRGEYIPPREDVILKNEDPRYVYVIHSGEVEVINTNEEGQEQVLVVLRANAIFGELGAILARPESYTYRTRSLTQVFRLKTKTLRRIMQENHRILRNFEQRHRGRHRDRRRELGESKGKAPLEAEVGPRIRVSIYKGYSKYNYDPDGAVIELPSSMPDLIRISGEIHSFDASEAILRNEEGDRIISIGVIRDNEKLFIGL